MKQFLTIISLLLLISCGFTNCKSDSNCSGTRDLEIGQVLVALPVCYTLHYPDSLDFNHLYLIKNDTIKLEIFTDGLASLEPFKNLKADNQTIVADTINNNLRLIKNNSDFSVFIVDLNRQDTVIFDLSEPSNQTLNEHRYYVKLDAKTPRDCKLSKIEAELLTKAFKTSKITDNEKSRS